jgi:uncharacterized membrane protein YagU involved in acid resistance
MPSVLAGVVAGIAATVPMSVVMELMHRQLPRRERYPLPPRRIIDSVVIRAGLDEEVDEVTRRELALLNHFAYGAAVGAAYGPIADRVPVHPAITGIGYGVGVWAVSYLGWVPALGILEPATEQPVRRNALMIAAHMVWGAATAYVAHRLDEPEPRSSLARRRGGRGFEGRGGISRRRMRSC